MAVFRVVRIGSVEADEVQEVGGGMINLWSGG